LVEDIVRHPTDLEAIARRSRRFTVASGRPLSSLRNTSAAVWRLLLVHQPEAE